MKSFYLAATIASASILNLHLVQSTSKCVDGITSEDGSCQSANRVKRTLDIDYPEILKGLLSPATISNHFTDIILFQTILAVGWVSAGLLFQLAKQINFEPDTKRRIEEMGFWFETDRFPASMGINIRNAIFGFFLGRVLFDVIVDPAGTQEEFENMTWTELRNRMLSNDYLATWLGRFTFQYLILIAGIAVLYGVSATQRTLFLEDQVQQVEFRNLDDLNDSVQASLLKDFV